MKQSKKILSALLALIMMISIVPLSSITASAATYSGTCGDSLTWTFDDFTGTLTISGTGEMYDYNWNIRPWESYKESIENVVINDGVTTIGDCAFSGYNSLASVTIGKSVAVIGNNAFSSCHGLTSITVDSNNQYYSSDEYGVLFNKDKTTLIQYPKGNTRTSYTIPDTMRIISDYSFAWCRNLLSITIPNGVTKIGDGAFAYCVSLENIIIPDSVTSIGESAFDWCTNLLNITIPNGVTTINDLMFNNCQRLTKVIIGDDVTLIGDFAFNSCYSLTDITIPDSVTKINDYAFVDCNNLTDVYYNGTKEDWNEIYIGEGNDYLINAKIHFNYCEHQDYDDDGYCDDCRELLDPTVECECNCHKTGISKFFFNFILFFQRLFGANKECACGVAHY